MEFDEEAGGGRADAAAAGESDPVVREIPVQLSAQLVKKLHLFQYPTRPRKRPFTKDMKCLNLQLQSEQVKVRMDFEANTDPRSYDAEHDTHLDRFRLSSMRVRNKTNYAVGMIANGKLHLTPLLKVVRMRPDLSYLDEADKKKQEAEEAAKRTASGTKKEKPQQVLHKFSRRSAPAHSKARQRMNLKRLNEAVAREPWNTLTYCSETTPESRSEKKLLSGDSSDSPSTRTKGMSKAEYLARVMHLCRGGDTRGDKKTEKDEDQDDDMEAGGPSQKELQREAELRQRISDLMMQAKVASFKEVCQQVGVKSADEVKTALRELSQIALLVQGNWVERSERSYKNRRALARTYLLGVFQETRIIRRAEIVKILQLDYEDTEKILNELALSRGDGIWEFRKPLDTEFIRRYAQVADDQRKKIAQKKISIQRLLLLPEATVRSERYVR